MNLPAIEYDEETDILTVDLTEPDQIVRTIELDGSTGVVIQLGNRDTPISIEIFDASTRYAKATLKGFKVKVRP